MFTAPTRRLRPSPALALLAAVLPIASMVAAAHAQVMVPIDPPPGARSSAPANLPPPVTESERQFRELSTYIRSRGEIDSTTRADIARVAAALDADLAKPGNPIATMTRLLAARVQAAIWVDDRDAINANFERLAAFSANKDPVLLAWARELVACAEWDRATEILKGHTFAEPALVDAKALLAQCYLASNNYDAAQAEINSAPSKRTQPQLSQIAQVAGRIEALRPLWNAEMVAMAKDQARGDLPLVELVTSKGPITIELFEDQAPNTVGNFIEHVEAGTYTGTRFHRVIRGFGVQGGDPATATGGEGGKSTGGWTIPDETLSDAKRAPLLGRLIVATQPDPKMAPAPKMNAAGCQFVMLLTHAEQLMGQYTVFGRISDGLDVARKLTADDTIASARVVSKRNHEYKGVRFSTDATGDFSMPPQPGVTKRVLETKIQKPSSAASPIGAPVTPVAPGAPGAPRPPTLTPTPAPRNPQQAPAGGTAPEQAPKKPASPQSGPPPLLTPNGPPLVPK